MKKMSCFNNNILIGKLKPKERELLWKQIKDEKLTHYWSNNLSIQGFNIKQINIDEIIEIDGIKLHKKEKK